MIIVPLFSGALYVYIDELPVTRSRCPAATVHAPGVCRLPLRRPICYLSDSCRSRLLVNHRRLPTSRRQRTNGAIGLTETGETLASWPAGPVIRLLPNMLHPDLGLFRFQQHGRSNAPEPLLCLVFCVFCDTGCHGKERTKTHACPSIWARDGSANRFFQTDRDIASVPINNYILRLGHHPLPKEPACQWKDKPGSRRHRQSIPNPTIESDPPFVHWLASSGCVRGRVICLIWKHVAMKRETRWKSRGSLLRHQRHWCS